MDISTLLYGISVWALPVLLAITLHEAGHAWAADKLGDPTAKALGRVSFNPIVHVDAVGTIAFPAFLVVIGSPFLFGWAKPVPVNYRNLQNLPHDIGKVAAAGPLANVLLIILSVIAFQLSYFFSPTVMQWIQINAWNSILINTILAAFNMIPIPPLDGSKVLQAYGPYEAGRWVAQVEQYGMMPILILIFGSSLISMATGINPLMYVIGTALEFVYWIVDPILFPTLEPSVTSP